MLLCTYGNRKPKGSLRQLRNAAAAAAPPQQPPQGAVRPAPPQQPADHSLQELLPEPAHASEPPDPDAGPRPARLDRQHGPELGGARQHLLPQVQRQQPAPVERHLPVQLDLLAQQLLLVAQLVLRPLPKALALTESRDSVSQLGRTLAAARGDK